MVADDLDVDEAAQVELLRSEELRHDTGWLTGSGTMRPAAERRTTSLSSSSWTSKSAGK